MDKFSAKLIPTKDKIQSTKIISINAKYIFHLSEILLLFCVNRVNYFLIYSRCYV